MSYKQKSSKLNFLGLAIIALATGICNAQQGRKQVITVDFIAGNLDAAVSPYKADIGTNGGFILKHSTGHFPINSEVDAPLSYADYYYVEALLRYKSLLVR